MSQPRHSLVENIVAITTGTLFCGFGVFLLHKAGLLIGGTAGLSLIATHLTDFSFGQIFFVLNIPFYWLAFTQMGWRFCLNTFIAVTGLSVVVDYAHLVINVESIEPLFAALFSGVLMGIGLLALFRHNASIGGVGILAFYLQKRFNIRAGKFQMAVDCSILAGSFFIVDLTALLISILSAVTLNLVVAMNHKPGRYQVAS